MRSSFAQQSNLSRQSTPDGKDEEAASLEAGHDGDGAAARGRASPVDRTELPVTKPAHAPDHGPALRLVAAGYGLLAALALLALVTRCASR